MDKYSSYKPSGIDWIGDIPKNWNLLKLKHEYKIQKGRIPKKISEKEEVGLVPYLSMEVLRGSETSSFVDNKDGVFVKEGQTLILWDGSNSGEIIKVEKEGILSSTMGVLNKTGNKLNEDFSFYQLKSHEPEIRNNTNGMGIPHVDGQYVRSLILLTPPLQEQEQIVKYLDEKTTIIDKLISTKQRKVELLKEQRTTLINQVITKGLNPNVKMKDSGVEWVGEIPERWSFVRLGVLGSFSKGKGITKDKIKENGFPCIRNGEIYTTYNLRFSEPKSFIDETTIFESIKVKKGTLFFTGDGETLEEIGKCVVYLGEEEIYVGGGINVFTPKIDKVSPIYLSYVMSSTSCVYQKSIGGKGEIVVHIYSKQLRDIQFGLPILEEQQEIVDYLDKHTKEIDDLVSMEQKKIELLKEYRQSLISEVITGKIKVVE